MVPAIVCRRFIPVSSRFGAWCNRIHYIDQLNNCIARNKPIYLCRPMTKEEEKMRWANSNAFQRPYSGTTSRHLWIGVKHCRTNHGTEQESLHPYFSRVKASSWFWTTFSKRYRLLDCKDSDAIQIKKTTRISKSSSTYWKAALHSVTGLILASSSSCFAKFHATWFERFSHCKLNSSRNLWSTSKESPHPRRVFFDE